VLLRTFGFKGQKLTGGCRKCHVEELHDLNSIATISGILNTKEGCRRIANHVWRK
jgi:hypothetical protein